MALSGRTARAGSAAPVARGGRLGQRGQWARACTMADGSVVQRPFDVHRLAVELFDLHAERASSAAAAS